MATPKSPCERSSEASLVATPLQPNAKPAQTMVTEAGERRKVRSR